MNLVRFRRSMWCLVSAMLVVFDHLVLARAAGYEFTAMCFLLPVWLYITFDFKNIKVDRLSPFVFVMFLCYPLLNYSYGYGAEFFKTYLLFFSFVVLVFVVTQLRVRDGLSKDFIFVCRALQTFFLIYAFFQLALYKFLGLDVLFNLWGSAQLHHLYAVWLHPENVRATALFLEPSFFGLVAVCLFWVDVSMTWKVGWRNFFVTLSILFFANSAAAYFSFIVLVSFFLLNNSGAKVRRAYFHLFVLAMFILFLFGGFSLFSRFDEFGDELSSGYWRLIFPVKLLGDFLPYSPFGLPFGSIESIVDSYTYLSVGEGWRGTSLDNGIYVFVYYFGVASMFIAGWLALLFFKGSAVVRYYVIYLLLLLNFNGAVFSLDVMLFLYILPILAVRLTLIKNKMSNARVG